MFDAPLQWTSDMQPTNLRIVQAEGYDAVSPSASTEEGAGSTMVSASVGWNWIQPKVQETISEFFHKT